MKRLVAAICVFLSVCVFASTNLLAQSVIGTSTSTEANGAVAQRKVFFDGSFWDTHSSRVITTMPSSD